MYSRKVKLWNLLLIFCILCIYQSYAQERAAAVEAYQAKKKEADAAWEVYYIAQAQETEKNNLGDGIYTGSGIGFGGEITVKVTILGGKIDSCKIVSAKEETPEYLKMAEMILDTVKEEQSGDVDVVSGATLSSNGILEGIKDCLEKAGKEKG